MQLKTLIMLLSIVFYNSTMERNNGKTSADEQDVRVDIDTLTLLEDIDQQALTAFLKPYFITNDLSLQAELSIQSESMTMLPPTPSTSTSKQRSKKRYSIVCYKPGCNKKFYAPHQSYLVGSLLRHIYTKFHNSSKYHEIEEITKKRARRTRTGFILECPYGCGQKLVENRICRLANSLIDHRFASRIHNFYEFKDLEMYIHTHSKEVRD